MTKRRVVVASSAAVVVAGLAVVVAHVLSGHAPAPVVGDEPAAGAGARAEVSGLAVTPLRTSVRDGVEEAATTFTLTNTGERDVVVVPRVVELSATGTPLPDSQASAAGWVTVAPRTQSIGPGRTAEFVVTVRPPPAREPGERRIGVVYGSDTATAGSVGLSSAVGTSVFVPGPGTVVRAIALGGLSAPRISWAGSIDLAVPVTNEGNVHRDFQTTGAEIAATSSGGGAFVFQQGVVLPGETSVLHGTWTPPLVCWCEIAVAMPDGTGAMVTTRTRILVVRPWLAGTVLVALVTVAALVLAGWRRRRRPGGAHAQSQPDTDRRQPVRS